MKKLHLLAFSVFALASTGFAQNARIRVVHASPDAPAVDIYVDGSSALEGLPFREYSDYVSVPSGTHNIQVKVSRTDTTVLQASPNLAADTDYTAIAVGYAGKQPGLDILLLTDDNTLPANNGVKLRVVHAAAGAPPVDIYATSPFAALSSATPALANVPFKAFSPYLTVPVANYQARVAVAGTKTVAIDSGRLVTWANMVRTVVAVDANGGGAPFSLIILNDRN